MYWGFYMDFFVITFAARISPNFMLPTGEIIFICGWDWHHFHKLTLCGIMRELSTHIWPIPTTIQPFTPELSSLWPTLHTGVRHSHCWGLKVVLELDFDYVAYVDFIEIFSQVLLDSLELKCYKKADILILANFEFLFPLKDYSSKLHFCTL